MNYRTVSYYPEFHCIGGKCEDSCCENWEIDLDDASLKRYMKQKGAFGKRLKESTRVREKQFILNGTRCPFLNDENLCDIFIEMGEDCLCQTCTNFPRHIEEFEDLKEVSLTMSCPEASRIMLSKKEKMEFVCRKGIDEEYGLKPVAEKGFSLLWKRPHTNKLDHDLFALLYDARNLIFQILQDRTVETKYRAAAVLLYVQEIQNYINEETYDMIAEKTDALHRAHQKGDLFSGKAFASDCNHMEPKKQQDFLKQVLNMFEGLETIKEEWKEILSDGMKMLQDCENIAGLLHAFDAYYKDKEYEFEHILVYYIFNYFLGAAYDKDALTKVKFAVVSYLVIKVLDTALWVKHNEVFEYEDQVLVAHAYSKEVEHSYNNFESLMLVLSAHPILQVEQILNGLFL